jgi:hypothetical protein
MGWPKRPHGSPHQSTATPRAGKAGDGEIPKRHSYPQNTVVNPKVNVTPQRHCTLSVGTHRRAFRTYRLQVLNDTPLQRARRSVGSMAAESMSDENLWSVSDPSPSIRRPLLSLSRVARTDRRARVAVTSTRHCRGHCAPAGCFLPRGRPTSM